MTKQKQYQVYMILCENGSIYTGISTDVDRRFKQHLSGRGAKFFRTTKPKKLIWSSKPTSRSDAMSQERMIKSFSHEGKVGLSGHHGVILDKIR
jgi:putative endonuclease